MYYKGQEEEEEDFLSLGQELIILGQTIFGRRFIKMNYKGAIEDDLN